MFRANQKQQFIRKKRAKRETFFAGWFEANRTINLFLFEQIECFIGVAWFNIELYLRKSFLKIPQDRRKNILARCCARANAQLLLTPL